MSQMLNSIFKGFLKYLHNPVLITWLVDQHNFMTKNAEIYAGLNCIFENRKYLRFYSTFPSRIGLICNFRLAFLQCIVHSTNFILYNWKKHAFIYFILF